MRKKRGLHKLFEDNPERAERIVLGRRDVLVRASLAAAGGVIGAAVPFGRFIPQGYLPKALAQDAEPGLLLEREFSAGIVSIVPVPEGHQVPYVPSQDEILKGARLVAEDNARRAQTRPWRFLY